jgi:hypothetical protein
MAKTGESGLSGGVFLEMYGMGAECGKEINAKRDGIIIASLSLSLSLSLSVSF